MASLVPRRASRSLETDIAAINRTQIAEAREALEYWRARAQRLPWYRWEARREARAIASRWRERLLHARLARWRLDGLAPVFTPLAAGRDGVARGAVRWLARPKGFVRRTILVACLMMLSMAAALGLAAVLAVQAVAHLV